MQAVQKLSDSVWCVYVGIYGLSNLIVLVFVAVFFQSALSTQHQNQNYRIKVFYWKNTCDKLNHTWMTKNTTATSRQHLTLLKSWTYSLQRVSHPVLSIYGLTPTIHKNLIYTNLLCQLCLTCAVWTSCADIIIIDAAKIPTTKSNSV
jgi:hypothetical protein